MRNIIITIYPLPNTSDITYVFSSESNYTEQVYALSSLILNYSILSSAIESELILSMNQTPKSTNQFRSGQLVEIVDNGYVVFQGSILKVMNKLLPVNDGGQGGWYTLLTIVPSIYQLYVSPVIFDKAQAEQINDLTGLNVVAILAAQVTQKINTQLLLDYMISNTFYNIKWNKTIESNNLPNEVFLMSDLGSSRDSVLRSSIDAYNTVLYQQEDGNIIIRQLSTNEAYNAPFNIDLDNKSAIASTISNAQDVPFIPLLTCDYIDNTSLIPSVVSNYAMLSPNLSSASGSSWNVLSYKPNPVFFPRVSQLAQAGWFVGAIGNTSIGTNIISDPTTSAVFKKYSSSRDQYMIVSKSSNVKDPSTAAYQALLTAKQLGIALMNYYTINALISLDDQYIDQESDMVNIIGKIIQIQNCDMQAGVIANCSRIYNAQGSYLNFSILPLGSITGYWST